MLLSALRRIELIAFLAGLRDVLDGLTRLTHST